VDVVFLSLEHGVSSRLAREVLDTTRALVVDLAADFRVQDVDLYREHYGEHPDPELVSRFRYALADIEGTALRGCTALAVPGCFATAAALALRPLATIALAQPPALFAVTGSSGAGTQPKESTHHPRRASNMQAYSVLGHRHEAEIAERWRAWAGPAAGRPRLMTHQGPFVRGIHLTLHARGEFRGSGRDLLAPVYDGCRFVRITDEPPALTHAVGTNVALVHAAVAREGGEIQIHVAIDNLIKGAAGQAIQAMNLALGLHEDAGLRLAGAFPC
jgi:N-acetyl-gamma-glutamyl-phosphate reductase common form